MKNLIKCLIIGIYINLTEGPQESEKPILERPRMTGHNGK